MGGVWHQAGCCCGEGGVVECGDLSPVDVMFAVIDRDDLPDCTGDAAKQYPPNAFTPGTTLEQTLMGYLDCDYTSVDGTLAGCGYTTLANGSDVPSFRLYSRQESTLDAAGTVDRRTMDITITPNVDVHIGLVPHTSPDDWWSAWVDGVHVFRQGTICSADEVSNPNCSGWYVKTVNANDTFRLQVDQLDFYLSWYELHLKVYLWRNASNDANWPNNLTLKVENN